MLDNFIIFLILREGMLENSIRFSIILREGMLENSIIFSVILREGILENFIIFLLYQMGFSSGTVLLVRT